MQESCVDAAVKILAAGLPARGLQDLRLSFEGCSRITDQSLTALGHPGRKLGNESLTSTIITRKSLVK